MIDIFVFMFRKHTGDMRYSCEVCGERFFVHGHMKRHLYSHTGIKPHSCRSVGTSSVGTSMDTFRDIFKPVAESLVSEP
jgi:uncharacterized Zn-finger protein